MPSSKFSHRHQITRNNPITQPGPPCQHGRQLVEVHWRWKYQSGYPDGDELHTLTQTNPGPETWSWMRDAEPAPNTLWSITLWDIEGGHDTLQLIVCLHDEHTIPLDFHVEFPYQPLPLDFALQYLAPRDDPQLEVSARGEAT